MVSWRSGAFSQAARPPFLGGGSPQRSSAAAPSTSLAGDGSHWGRTSPLPLPLPLCCVGRGGSKLIHWLSCDQTPPHSTGTVSSATPCNNQDVRFRSSWDDLRNNRKSAKYSTIKTHVKYPRSAETKLFSQQFVWNTFSTTILAS